MKLASLVALTFYLTALRADHHGRHRDILEAYDSHEAYDSPRRSF